MCKAHREWVQCEPLHGLRCLGHWYGYDNVSCNKLPIVHNKGIFPFATGNTFMHCKDGCSQSIETTCYCNGGDQRDRLILMSLLTNEARNSIDSFTYCESDPESIIMTLRGLR
jgi:hypothetical protein